MANLIINLSSLTVNNTGNIYKDIIGALPTNFEAASDVNAIKQSINNIFSWRRGERIINPAFGNIIYNYVDELITDITLKNLRSGILQMMAYEPRINVVALNITPNAEQNTINISLKYIIPALNIIDSFSINVNVVSS